MRDRENNEALFLASLLYCPALKTGSEELAGRAFMDEAIKLVEDCHFLDQQLLALWKTLRDMHQRGLAFTPATIISCLGIDRDKYREALHNLLIVRRPLVASPANWRYYADLMIENSRVVYLQSHLVEFQARLEHESSDEILPDLNNLVTKIAVRQMRDSPRPIDEWVDLVVEDMKRRDEGKVQPARWGLQTLDFLFPRGIEPGDLVVVGGRPGQGKTAFALQLTAHNVVAGKKVLFFTIEMTAISLVRRLWAHVSHIPINALYGQGYEWRSEKAMGFADDLKGWRDRLWILPAENQFERILSTISMYRQQYGIDGVVLDYIGLVRSRKLAEKRYLEVAHYSHEINYMCKSLGMWCLMVSQLNREVAGSGRFGRPGMERLRECVVAGTRLIDANTGVPIKIRDVVPGMSVLGLSNDQKVRSGVVKACWKTGTKDVYRLTTSGGREVVATANHPVLTQRGWVAIQNLRPLDDNVAVAYRIPDAVKVSEERGELCRFLGYLAGNGSYLKNKSVGVIIPDEDCFRDIVSIVSRHWPSLSVVDKNPKYHDLSITVRGGCGTNGNELINWLREIGVHGERCESKRVSGFVFASGPGGAANFLAGYLATDGCVKHHNGRCEACFDTTSKQLATDTYLLLAKLGIACLIGKATRNSKSTTDLYRVTVSRDMENMIRFSHSIRPLGRKRKLVDDLMKESLVNGWRVGGYSCFRLPVCVSELTSIGTDWRHQGKSISRRACLQVATENGRDDLSVWANSDVLWEGIRSIVPEGREDVYDLAIPGVWSFLADGIISHNSGDVEQDADAIVMVYQDRERTDEDRGRRPITLWVEKHRHEEAQRGALAWFIGATQRIVDAPERANEGLDTDKPLDYNEIKQSCFAVSSSPF